MLIIAFTTKEVSKIEILLSILFGATIMDCISFKIKNQYLLISFFVSIAYQIYSNDFQILVSVFIGIFLTFVLLYPVYLIRGIGAGDVKLFMVISIFFSFEEMPWMIFTAFLIGAIEGVFLLFLSKFRGRNIHIHFTIPITISVLLKIGGVY